MKPLKQEPHADDGRRGSEIDAVQRASIKAGSKFTKDRKNLEASMYWARKISWEKGEKPMAMEAWAQRVMAVDLTRKAVKAAWALSYVFNNYDGACFEKKPKLAARAGLSVQGLKDGLTELEKMSLIKRMKEQRQGRFLTVIYPAEPVRKSLDTQDLKNLGSQDPNRLGTQDHNCLGTQDPCIPEGSLNISLNPYSESTARYIRKNGLSEEEESELDPEADEHCKPDDQHMWF